jgi:hypothetical protein
MLLSLLQFVRCLAACALIALLIPQTVAAESHVVTPTDLQKQMIAAAQTRQSRIAQVTQFLSTDKAKTALTSAGMDPQKVKTAVAALNEDELSQLATRVNKAQADFAAGNINDHDLILIVLAIAVLVLIIVAVR